MRPAAHKEYHQLVADGRLVRATVTAGEILGLVRATEGITRALLAEHTGLSRMALNQRLSLLSRSRLIVADGHDPSTGGRPSARFVFNSRAGLVVGLDIGITAARVGIADLSGEILAETSRPASLDDGPEPVLQALVSDAEILIDSLGASRSELWGVGAGVPGPVEFEQGRVVSAPFMPGWQEYPIRARLADRLGCPAVVDKDANIMALGEHRASWSQVRHLLFVKVGTGIGCGVIADGRVYRGANGAAGDVGHIQLRGYGDPPCRCGNIGCVEAIAGGWALVRDLRNQGVNVDSAVEVAELARGRHREVLQLVRRSGRVLGDALSDAVNFFNPEVVVIGGSLASAHGELLAGTREIVYQRSLALATRDLQIVTSSLGDRAGIVGAAHLVIEHILTPAAVDRWLVQPPAHTGSVPGSPTDAARGTL